MAKTSDEAHVRYAVRTPAGFLGTRRYDYTRGSHALGNTAFKTARIFTRRCDAEAASTTRDEVVEVRVELVSP